MGRGGIPVRFATNMLDSCMRGSRAGEEGFGMGKKGWGGGGGGEVALDDGRREISF